MCLLESSFCITLKVWLDVLEDGRSPKDEEDDTGAIDISSEELEFGLLSAIGLEDMLLFQMLKYIFIAK